MALGKVTVTTAAVGPGAFTEVEGIGLFIGEVTSGFGTVKDIGRDTDLLAMFGDTAGAEKNLTLTLIAARVFDGRLDDRAHLIATYERNTAEVEAAFDRRRLLIHRLGDGWQPLCRFLGKPVPDTPYPRTNSTVEFEAMTAAMGKPGD